MWYESERLVAILLFFFGIVCLINTVTATFTVPNTLIAGVLLLLFGKSLYTEAMLDKIDEIKEKKEP